MYFVRPLVVGEDGLGCIDPDRRDRLPAQTWRAVPRNAYWLRLHSMGDVLLLTERPPEDQIEGYVAPEPGSVVPVTVAVGDADGSGSGGGSRKKGSDA